MSKQSRIVVTLFIVLSFFLVNTTFAVELDNDTSRVKEELEPKPKFANCDGVLMEKASKEEEIRVIEDKMKKAGCNSLLQTRYTNPQCDTLKDQLETAQKEFQALWDFYCENCDNPMLCGS